MKLTHINENLDIDPEEVVKAFLTSLEVAKAKSAAEREARAGEPWPEKGGPAAPQDPEAHQFYQKFHKDQADREFRQSRASHRSMKEGDKPQVRQHHDALDDPLTGRHRPGDTHGRKVPRPSENPPQPFDPSKKMPDYPSHPFNPDEWKKSSRSMEEGRFQFDKKTGGMTYDNSDPDQRHGLYLNGKLIKTYNSKGEAESVKARDPRFREAEIKKIAEGGIGGGSLGQGVNQWNTNNPVSYENTLDEKSDKDSPFAKIVDKWLNFITMDRTDPGAWRPGGPVRRKAPDDEPISVPPEPEFKRSPIAPTRHHEPEPTREPKKGPGTFTNVDMMRPTGLPSQTFRPSSLASRTFPKGRRLSFEERLAEFVELDEISKGEKDRQKKAALHAKSEQERLEREAAKKNDERIAKRHVNRDKRIGKKFADILQKQHDEKPAEPVAAKAPTVTIPYHGWEIKYRPGASPGQPVEWSVNRGNKMLQGGQAATDKEAVGAAEEWIKMNAGQKGSFNKNATIDFNKPFMDKFAPGGQTFYGTFTSQNGQPHFIYSQEPHEGLEKSSIRRAGFGFPSLHAKPSVARPSYLQPHGRYLIDTSAQQQLDEPGVYMYPLIFQGIIQDKSEREHMKGPGFTVAYARDKDVEEAIDPWKGYTPDDPNYAAATKRGASLRGSPEVPLSELICDTIRTHGIRWAFKYYVLDRNLPPRMFKILAKDALENP